MSGRPAGSGWPGPRRPAVCIKVEPELLEHVAELAREAGVTRSAWLRGAIDAAVSSPDIVKPRR